MSDKGATSTKRSRRSPTRRKTARTESEPLPEDTSDVDMRAHRRRQESVAALLDQTFGRLADCSPDLWDRRAYLMLVGLVYERLATNEDEIPTDELVTLAKVLAENRRAEARSSENQRSREENDAPAVGTGELPTGVDCAVRQVYGTNLGKRETPGGAPDCTPSSNPDSDRPACSTAAPGCGKLTRTPANLRHRNQLQSAVPNPQSPIPNPQSTIDGVGG